MVVAINMMTLIIENLLAEDRSVQIGLTCRPQRNFFVPRVTVKLPSEGCFGNGSRSYQKLICFRS